MKVVIYSFKDYLEERAGWRTSGEELGISSKEPLDELAMSEVENARLLGEIPTF